MAPHAAAVARSLTKRVVEQHIYPNGTVVDIVDGELYTWGLNGVDNSENLLFTNILYISLATVIGIVLFGRFFSGAAAQIRLMLCASTESSEGQSYWKTPRNSWVPFIKKHALYAPLGKKRHNTELKLSSVINVGTLPTRLQTLMLTLYLASNVCYCTLMLDWRQPTAPLVAEFRGRTGVMAVVNMIPLFLLAGRNNPLIPLLGFSFDTYNLLHRWMGRMVVIESVAHTAAWTVNKVAASGWSGVWDKVQHSPFIITGVIGTLAMIFLMMHSLSSIRHAFYETFLVCHQLVAAMAVIAIYYHIKIDQLPQMKYFIWVIFLWAFDRAVRLARIFYRNIGTAITDVTIEALPGDACRVEIACRRPWTFTPGAHLYLYLPTLSFWQSHPFSIAWCDDKVDDDFIRQDSEASEKPIVSVEPSTMKTRRKMYLIIHRKKGMTNSLYERASKAPGRKIRVKGFAEGPYGGLHNFDSYGTVVLVAGGVGITHMISYIKPLIEGINERRIATRKIVLVWTVREREQLEWIRPWMDVILAMKNRREILKILLFVTRPKTSVETVSSSSSVQLIPSRPNFDTIFENELADRVGATAVTVCGGGSISDAVRSSVRKRLDRNTIDFVEESFSW
ncbi:hypothetical protein BJ508DRAFT_317327 [Ascobolus immersus RN42]|uniref:ferric-chelate reductase (NADPH) n=1 Tax=Ascobolus immersus RN42 TaxID=1160509 RepID=A0A3N4IGN8_ASCIM|nr:hypothetical protein BJ508DRAFT_317327 [Ascobolus immersus RN42]